MYRPSLPCTPDRFRVCAFSSHICGNSQEGEGPGAPGRGIQFYSRLDTAASGRVAFSVFSVRVCICEWRNAPRKHQTPFAWDIRSISVLVALEGKRVR